MALVGAGSALHSLVTKHALVGAGRGSLSRGGRGRGSLGRMGGGRGRGGRGRAVQLWDILPIAVTGAGVAVVRGGPPLSEHPKLSFILRPAIRTFYRAVKKKDIISVAQPSILFIELWLTEQMNHYG